MWGGQGPYKYCNATDDDDDDDDDEYFLNSLHWSCSCVVEHTDLCSVGTHF
jgi:hypothetical protein